MNAPPGAERLEVFAVEDDAAQVCWAALPPGPHRWRAGDAEVDVPEDAAARPGAVRLAPLPADTALAVELDGREVLRLRTLAPPPGRALARVATISDLHLGEVGFGHLPAIRDEPGAAPHSLVCVRAALEELRTWGPDLLVVKGDLSHECREEEFEAVAKLLAPLDLPTLVVPGNHDGGNHQGADPAEVLARFGVPLVTGIAVSDLPGLRVVAANSRMDGKGHGVMGPVLADAADALRGAPGGALLALHHHPQRTIVPTHWPPGILGLDGHRFLRAVERSHPATFVTSGHTHRHRRRRHGPVVITEVGSVKDYPGTWAGYVAHEGGIRQVVHRVAHPDAIAWTERTRRMGLGQWGRWSPGHLTDRCFSHAWPH